MWEMPTIQLIGKKFKKNIMIQEQNIALMF